MSQYVNQKQYSEFLGVDLKADNVNRSPEFSPDGGQNIIFGPRGEIRKMPGAHKVLTAYGNYGAYFLKFRGYNRDNDLAEEMISMTSLGSIYRYYEEYITLTYAGAGTASFQIGQDDGSQGIYLYVNSSLVYSNTTLGTSVATIVAAISAVSGWTATFPGSGTMLLESLYRQELTTLTTSSTYAAFGISQGSILAINMGSTAPIDTIEEYDTLQSSVVLNNVLYFTDTSGYVMKYDGHFIYPAGLPIPTATFTAYSPIGGSLSTTGYYTIALRTKAIDYGGNTVYSDWKIYTQSTSGNTDIVAAISLSGGSGIVGTTLWLNANALHTAQTTINVTTDPRTYFRAGDKICCFRSGNILTPANTAQYATVVSTTASSITLDTAITIDPAYNERITHRVTVEVWRTTKTTAIGNTSGPFYKIQEISCRQDGTSQPLSLTDAAGGDSTMSAGCEILTSIRRWNNNTGGTKTEPPRARYLSTFQDSLVLSDYSTPNLVHFSDQEGPEQFDLAVNNFTVEGVVTAIGSTKDLLAVFKEENIDILVGDIKGYSVRVDRVDDVIGCVAHSSVQSVDESSIYFLSKKGPYQIRSGGISPLGPHILKSGQVCSRLEPFYTKKRQDYHLSNGANTPHFAMARANSVIWREKNLYLIYVPLESKQYYGVPSTSLATADYEITCYPYDYLRGIWLPPWNIKPNLAVNVFGRLFFRTLTTPATANLRIAETYTVSNTGTGKDFLTATGFDESKYVFGWYNLGDPSQFKKFLRVRFFCHESVDNSTFSMDLKVNGDFRDGTYTTSIDGITMTVGEERKIKLSSQKARAIKITIESGTAGEDISINGVILEWTPVYRQGLKE